MWFLAKDTLFGNGEQALYLGRKVHSLEYAHEPGYLFLKMDSSFLNSVREMGDSVSNEAAIGVLDAEGTVCAAWYPKYFSMSRSTLTRLWELAEETRSGVVVQSEKVADGMLFAYRQAETGFTVFTIVPEHVLTKGSRQVVLVLLVSYLFVIAFAGVLSIYFSKRITKPIWAISKAMMEFDAEEKAEPIHLNTKTELDQIGNSYNKMVSNTQELLAEINVQQQELRTS